MQGIWAEAYTQYHEAKRQGFRPKMWSVGHATLMALRADWDLTVDYLFAHAQEDSQRTIIGLPYMMSDEPNRFFLISDKPIEIARPLWFENQG